MKNKVNGLRCLGATVVSILSNEQRYPSIPSEKPSQPCHPPRLFAASCERPDLDTDTLQIQRNCACFFTSVLSCASVRRKMQSHVAQTFQNWVQRVAKNGIDLIVYSDFGGDRVTFGNCTSHAALVAASTLLFPPLNLGDPVRCQHLAGRQRNLGATSRAATCTT